MTPDPEDHSTCAPWGMEINAGVIYKAMLLRGRIEFRAP